MKLDTELLLVATDALHTAERENENIEMTRDGASRYTIRDRARPPMQDILYTGDDFASANLELNVIRDARRITAVAKIIAQYERERVWRAALDAVRASHIPSDTKGVPAELLIKLEGLSPEQGVLQGAQNQKNYITALITSAAEKDLAL